MMRTVAILAVIFIAVTAAVHLGYRYLEKELQQASCVPLADDKKNNSSVDNDNTVNTAAEQDDHISGPSEPLPPVQDFQIIVRRDIFQVVQAAQAEKQQKTPEPEPAPQAVPTSLNLTLAGTLIGSRQTARAIVVDNAAGGREQLLLRVGDGVQGAVIKSIEWNKITLEVNGALEVLEMPKPDERSSLGRGIPRSAAFSRPSIARPPVSEQTVNRRRPPTRPRRRISLPEELESDHDLEEPPDLPDLDLEEPSLRINE